MSYEAEAWPVNNGSVGKKGSANAYDPMTDPYAEPGRPGGMNENKPAPGASSSKPVPESSKSPYTGEEKKRVVGTKIQDITLEEVFQTIDTFLKSAGGGFGQLGGLLAGGLSGILDKVGGVVSQLLSTTSLTNVFGGIVNNIVPAIGQAIQGFTDAIGEVAGPLFKGITNTLDTALPGLGSALNNFGGAIGQLGNNISAGYNALPEVLKTGVTSAVAGAVAGKFTSIDPGLAAGVVGAIRFADNPVGHLNEVKAAAQTLTNVLGNTLPDVNNGLQKVIQSSNNAGTQLGQIITPTDNGFSINPGPLFTQNVFYKSVSGQLVQLAPKDSTVGVLKDGITIRF